MMVQDRISAAREYANVTAVDLAAAEERGEGESALVELRHQADTYARLADEVDSKMASQPAPSEVIRAAREAVSMRGRVQLADGSTGKVVSQTVNGIFLKDDKTGKMVTFATVDDLAFKMYAA